MSRKRRMQDLREKKDKRAKRLAVGGAVLLAIVLAFELPHYLGGGGSPAPAATTSATGTGDSTTTTATTTTTAAGSASLALPPTTNTRLPNSDPQPRRTKSQLYSFSHFAGKDPFVQQVSAQTASPSSSAAPASSSTPASTASSGGGSAPAQQTSARTLAQSGAATIQVNGKAESVRVGASFPSSNPIFKLVSLSNGGARIGIANGSYASGTQTVSLSSGRTLTLVDTADGVRYKLHLLSGS